MKVRREPWPGGYVHRQKDGQPLYIIEREVNGRRFHKSTRAHGLRAAMKQLERFEADPFSYAPEGARPEGALFLTVDLADQFWDYQIARGVSRKHANSCGNRLGHWIEDLYNVDLRRATLRDHIKPALKRRVTQYAHRISTLKSFYGWLREEEHILTSSQDPTLDMPVPQSKPEKHRRRKAVDVERVRAVLPHLAQPYRDCLVILSATGWHVTELERFIRAKESEIIEMDGRGGVVAVLCALHKGGEFTRTPITDREVLDAAKRRRAYGKMPKQPNEALKEACRQAKVTRFTLGVLRHTVATWAAEAEASPQKISEFLQHKDPRTTKRFYIDIAAPTVTLPLPRLRVVAGGKR